MALNSTLSSLTALSPSLTSLASSRLTAAGKKNNNTSNASPIITTNNNVINDTRVRLSLPPGSTQFYKDQTNNLLAILGDTDGVIFPFQPAISLGYSATYQPQVLTHSNFTYYSYQNSQISPINISGDFVVRNPYEGKYVFAAMTFLRACTMMNTGAATNPNIGAPPPILRLTGMGFGGYDNIPVGLTNVMVNYPPDVDFVTVYPGLTTGETSKIPVEFSMVIDCQPMFSRSFATSFDSSAFSSGLQRTLGPGV